MPLAIHPVLRQRQEAMEALGLVRPMDSTVVSRAKLDEAAGNKKKIVPAGSGAFIIINGRRIQYK